MQTAQEMAVAEQIGRELNQKRVDSNEVVGVVGALREMEHGARFFEYLETIVRNGDAVVRSNRTIDYYSDMRDVCRRHLRPYQDDPHTMAEILGWAARLMRYYKIERNLEQPPARTPHEEAPVHEPEQDADRLIGTVKWFSSDRGYGFIKPDAGGDDMFVYHSQLAGGLTNPSKGTRVSYVIGKGPKGRDQAQDVRPA